MSGVQSPSPTPSSRLRRHFGWLIRSRQSQYGRGMNIRTLGFLFDLDGGLVDSPPAVARCWSRWSLLHGFVAEEVVRRAHGRPSLVTLRELLPNADHQAEDRQMERSAIEDIAGGIPLPGFLSLLTST